MEEAAASAARRSVHRAFILTASNSSHDRFDALFHSGELREFLRRRAGPAGAERQCYSTAETRDQIAAHALSEPLRSIQKAAAHFQAEALGARLCRRNDVLMYEISLLRRDGKIVHCIYDAKTGQIIEPKPAKEREE